MLDAIIILFCCQLAGEMAVAALHIPVPGPVLGMLLLFLGLMVKKSVPEGLARTGDSLLGNLSLLFVPAGVGVMLQAGRLQKEWLPISIALVASTIITIAVTALVMRWISGRKEGAEQ